jgi:hypothetical protein
LEDPVMKRSLRLTPLAAIVALALGSATPALAQKHARGGDHSGESAGRQSEGRAVERAQPRSEQQAAPAPRQEQRRTESAVPRQEQRRTESAAVPRQEQRQPQSVAPQQQQQRQDQRRTEAAVPRTEQRRPDEQRRTESVAPRVDQRRTESAVPRVEQRRYESAGRDNRRYESNDRRYDSRGRYDSRYYTPRYDRYYAPRVYVYRPYTFRPRFSIGFGVYAGYDVPYTYAYPYSYRNAASLYGGVALEIDPPDGEVYADGQYVGLVEDFDGIRQPLTLSAGTHHLEVYAPGYPPLVFDVLVQPGRVIPFRGDARP